MKQGKFEYKMENDAGIIYSELLSNMSTLKMIYGDDLDNIIKQIELNIQMKDITLNDKEKEIATVLIKDGWYGTFDELIECVKNLSH